MFVNYIFVSELFMFFTVNGQACEKLVSLPATQPVLRYDFNYTIQDVIIELVNPNNNPIFRVSCFETCSSAEYLNSTLASTGDITTGKFHIKLDSFGDGQQGNYRFRAPGWEKVVSKCINLYMLGTPSPSTISANSEPYEGGTVKLTCHSISTTDPPGHDLVMSYTWTKDGTNLTSGGRFILLPNTAATLTLNDVQRNGPDNIAFNSTGVSLALSDGDRFSPVACLADCKPSCTFRWTKGQIYVTSSAVLDIGIVGSDDQGIYTCTGTHSIYTTYTNTKNYSVIVLCKL
ncbi:hypothetical protein MAR_021088 [Mya arenaria]|uniref:Ig-like domain-containing protein n=1 Tax=Mya arenaria TaxID=6604 RepID=A0ABY7EBC4_MYAAR|nr:hypothetical protein MAR_021088 [Mya arenaria]